MVDNFTNNGDGFYSPRDTEIHRSNMSSEELERELNNFKILRNDQKKIEKEIANNIANLGDRINKIQLLIDTKKPKK